mgnify:FL=1
MEVLFILFAAVIGFATGALVYRNNAERLEDELKDVKAKLEKLKGK